MPRPEPPRAPQPRPGPPAAPASISPQPAAWAADLDAIGLAADESQLGALQRYLELLLHWNRTYNLTSIRDPAAAWVQHVLDCLAALPAVRTHLATLTGPRVLDVGSGGGLPGVVWSLFLPTVDVTCVDTVGKKAAFVRQAASELHLPRLHALHARVEALRDVRGYDLVVCRAFASLADFTRLTAALLAPGGCWLALKGRLPQDEIDELPATVEVFHVEPVSVPHLGADRCLVWMRPTDQTQPG